MSTANKYTSRRNEDSSRHVAFNPFSDHWKACQARNGVRGAFESELSAMIGVYFATNHALKTE
jgi:hypothetical protein